MTIFTARSLVRGGDLGDDLRVPLGGCVGHGDDQLFGPAGQVHRTSHAEQRPTPGTAQLARLAPSSTCKPPMMATSTWPPRIMAKEIALSK